MWRNLLIKWRAHRDRFGAFLAPHPFGARYARQNLQSLQIFRTLLFLVRREFQPLRTHQTKKPTDVGFLIWCARRDSNSRPPGS